jgi:hypothetical protein
MNVTCQFSRLVEQNPLLSGYVQPNPVVTPQYRPAGFYPQQFPLYYPAVPSGSLYGSQALPYQGVFPAVTNPYFQGPFYPGAASYSSNQRVSVKYNTEFYLNFYLFRQIYECEIELIICQHISDERI